MVILTFVHEMVSPIGKSFKRLGTSDVIDHATAISSPVKRTRQALKPLLSRCVPNLQHAHFVFHHHFPVGKVCSNGGLEVVRELALLEEVDE